MTRDEFIFKKVWPDRCWHEFDDDPKSCTFTMCKECLSWISSLPSGEQHNPDFSTWEGFGMLLEGMMGRERWDTFMQGLHVHEVTGPQDTLPLYYINPPAFADKVAEFFGWGGREK